MALGESPYSKPWNLACQGQVILAEFLTGTGSGLSFTMSFSPEMLPSFINTTPDQEAESLN